MENIYDRKYKIKKPSSGLFRSDVQESERFYAFHGYGYVTTPSGVVCFDTYNFKHKVTKSKRQTTHLRIIFGGYEYVKDIKKTYSERYIITIAHRFSKELSSIVLTNSLT